MQSPSCLRFPFNTICHLERDKGNGFEADGGATGTLIAPQVVLTAKHCLLRVSPPCRRRTTTGPVYRAFRITPGADLSAASQRHRRPASPSSQVATASGVRFDSELDYGVIILPQAFAAPRRFMSLHAHVSTDPTKVLNVAGYPCDKPRGTLWGHAEPMRSASVRPEHVEYTMDTCPGHSGSPVWRKEARGSRRIVAVHTTGAGDRCQNDAARTRCERTGAAPRAVQGRNCGVRVTPRVIEKILGWCREFRVQPPTVSQGARG